MKHLKLYILLLPLIGMVAYGCENTVRADEENTNPEKSKNLEQDDLESTKTKIIEITLKAKSESKASGDITFEEKNGHVAMKAKFKGLKPGNHAIHLHEKADCSTKDGKSSGGHWNPTNKQHGKWGDPEGYHKGDIGNFMVDVDGNGIVTFETDEWCIGCADTTKNIIGRALIIHQGGDDFISQPSGDAGIRVGCAEITEYKEK